MACLQVHAYLAFVFSPGLQAQGIVLPTVGWAFQYQLSISPPKTPHKSSALENPSTETPFSGKSELCQVGRANQDNSLELPFHLKTQCKGLYLRELVISMRKLPYMKVAPAMNPSFLLYTGNALHSLKTTAHLCPFTYDYVNSISFPTKSESLPPSLFRDLINFVLLIPSANRTPKRRKCQKKRHVTADEKQFFTLRSFISPPADKNINPFRLWLKFSFL